MMEPTFMGGLRNRLFSPDPADVTFVKRGFHSQDSERTAGLEKVGATFLDGFGYGMAGRDLPGMERSLETVDRPMRGFGYEGCAMALAIRDALRPVGRHWVRDFLASRGDAHVYMVHVGVGWAMARLPSLRWGAIMPADRLLRWLALDGYGFHQAYFRTSQYVYERFQGPLPVWRPAGYPNRVVDQGIGRALWFVSGADVQRLAQTIGRFARGRRGDLWSGAGLASVYAGGSDVDDLETMARLAGEYRPDVAQGAAFAAKARVRAGLVTPHTELAVKVYCGMPADQAAAVTDDALESLPDSADGVPAFELWRQRIRKQFA